MTIESAIRALMLADGTVSAALGERVYSGYAPQDADKPYAIISRSGTDVDHHMGGASGLEEVTIDLWLFGVAKAALDALAARCKAVLDSVNDRTTASGIAISKLWITDQADDEILIPDGTGRPVRSIRQQYSCHYTG